MYTLTENIISMKCAKLKKIKLKHEATHSFNCYGR